MPLLNAFYASDPPLPTTLTTPRAPPELNPRILTTTDYDELLGPLWTEDDEIEVTIPRRRAVTKRKASLPPTSPEKDTSSSENDDIESTIPQKPTVTKRKASLSSISQE
jgi:hypothetical protein